MKTNDKSIGLFWLVIGLFLLSSLISCSTQRNSTLSTNTTIDDNVKKDTSHEEFERRVKISSDSISEVKFRLYVESYEKNINANINKREYDTDKPIDPTTGKPPLKSETNIDYTSTEQRHKKEVEALKSVIVSKDITIDSLTVINKEQSEQITKFKEQLELTETKQVNVLELWQKVFITIGIVAVILSAILILWLIFRFIKK